MASLPPKNFLPPQMQLAGLNDCVDHSPDLRFCAATGDGQPATSAQGPIRAQNNYHINITNQPGAIIDVGKIQDMISPVPNVAPGLLPTLTPRPSAQLLDHKDLRLTLSSKRTSPHQSMGLPAPGFQIPTAPAVAAPPAISDPIPTRSSKRRCRTMRQTGRLIAATIASIPAPAPDDRISDLLAAVTSMQAELKAQRLRATSTAPPCVRAPSSPPGPPPDIDSDSMFSLALRYRYVPLSPTLGGRAPPARTPDLRPPDLDSSFRALQDSDPLLRRRIPRSRSPSRSPGTTSRRRRLELNTPTSFYVCRLLSPYCRGFSRAHRHRSPPRGSRSSPSSWAHHGQRDSRRARPASPPRPTLHRKPTRRHPSDDSPPTDLQDAPAEDSATAPDAAGPAQLR
jgi:hypothetical protein